MHYEREYEIKKYLNYIGGVLLGICAIATPLVITSCNSNVNSTIRPYPDVKYLEAKAHVINEDNSSELTIVDSKFQSKWNDEPEHGLSLTLNATLTVSTQFVNNGTYRFYFTDFAPNKWWDNIKMINILDLGDMFGGDGWACSRNTNDASIFWIYDQELEHEKIFEIHSSSFTAETRSGHSPNWARFMGIITIFFNS